MTSFLQSLIFRLKLVQVVSIYFIRNTIHICIVGRLSDSRRFSGENENKNRLHDLRRRRNNFHFPRLVCNEFFDFVVRLPRLGTHANVKLHG